MLLRRRRSIISEFDLVCDEDWGAQLVNSGYFVGFLIGAGLWGTLSDQIGAPHPQSCMLANSAPVHETLTLLNSYVRLPVVLMPWGVVVCRAAADAVCDSRGLAGFWHSVGTGAGLLVACRPAGAHRWASSMARGLTAGTVAASMRQVS